MIIFSYDQNEGLLVLLARSRKKILVFLQVKRVTHPCFSPFGSFFFLLKQTQGLLVAGFQG